MHKLIMTLTALLLLAGCTQSVRNIDIQSEAVDFTAKEWRLERIGDAPVIDASQTTIFFGRDGKVHGNGGCNAYSGIWKEANGELEVGQLASTLRICAAEALNRQEMLFFRSLGKVRSAEVDPRTGALVLTTADDVGPMLFHEVRHESTAQGSLIYRERIALGPQAVAVVRILDVSRADAPAVPVAEQTIRNPGQVPIRFAVEYDPEDIRPGHTYVVRAEIRDRGRLLFTTDTRYLLTNRPETLLMKMVHD